MATTTIDTYVVTAGKPVILKDPNAVLDYAFNWGAYLAPISDSIASVTWVLDATLTKTQQSNDTTTATVWLSGGVAPASGGTLRVTCRITTTGGRTDDRSIFLKILER